MNGCNNYAYCTSARRFVAGFIMFASLFPAGFSLAVYSPINYFQITYSPTVFSKTLITNGGTFTATIKSKGVATQNPPSSADAVRFSYRYTANNKATGKEIVLNPLQTLTVEPFPQKQGESYSATNVASLRFPAGSASGDYTVVETITNIEMKDSGLDWRPAPKPSKPAPPTKPSAPSQPTQPSGPGSGGTESSQPTQQSKPTKPSKPPEPTRPSEPTRPAEPTAPPGPRREIGTVTYAPAVAPEPMIPAPEPELATEPELIPVSDLKAAPAARSTVAALALSPASVIGGATSVGKITLVKPAPVGGQEVMLLLMAPNNTLSFPAKVTVSAGATTGIFNITTKAVNSPLNVTITATLGMGSPKQAAVLTINPTPILTVSALSISPATVTGGDSAIGTVTLSGPAPTSNKVVRLSASPSDSLIIPGNVVVKASETSATFDIKTKKVTSAASAIITATLDSSQKTASLTINSAPAVCAGTCVRSDQPGPSGMMGQGTDSCPSAKTGSYRCRLFSTCYYYTPQVCYVPIPIPLILNVSPASVINNTSAVGTVILGYPAPAGGQVVQLSANTSAVTVPTNATVPAGATMGTFEIKTNTVSSIARATIEATLGNYRGSATLTVEPTPPPPIFAFTVSPNSLVNGGSAVGTVTLSNPAPAGGQVAQLLANPTGTITYPSIVRFLAGATTGTFNIQATKKVTAPLTVTITATLNNFQKITTFIVNPTPPPPTMSAVTVSPAQLVGGAAAVGTVTLDSVAPANGQVVMLSSNTFGVSLYGDTFTTSWYSWSPPPPQVTVKAGATTGTFKIQTNKVSSLVTAVITATANKSQKTAQFTINPAPVACTDSDNGRNYTVKGSVKTATFSGNDSCDDSKLAEYYCLNSPSAYGDMFGVVEYNCPNGCKDGACLPAPR
ncbi:MAG: hypothetical protein Q7R85_04160 [bacterium]|nr:hypothetical protein [bacterium]